MWAYVADPAQADFERLFFALYGRALQGDGSGAPPLHAEPRDLVGRQRGAGGRGRDPLRVARAHARLGLAVTRGLLLDLLATGDRAGTDAALEVFARRYAGRWWEARPAGSEDAETAAGTGTGTGTGTSDRAS